MGSGRDEMLGRVLHAAQLPAPEDALYQHHAVPLVRLELLICEHDAMVHRRSKQRGGRCAGAEEHGKQGEI